MPCKFRVGVGNPHYSCKYDGTECSNIYYDTMHNSCSFSKHMEGIRKVVSEVCFTDIDRMMNNWGKHEKPVHGANRRIRADYYVGIEKDQEELIRHNRKKMREMGLGDCSIEDDTCEHCG